MQKPAQEPRKHGLFLRVRAWLQRRRPRSVPQQDLVMLPRSAALFSDTLLLSLPADFRPQKTKRGSGVHMFTGSQSGLRLTVMQVPFDRMLQRVDAVDLDFSFRRAVPHRGLPRVRHGFLRHSPTLTAEWIAETKTVLRMIQVRKTVYLLMFEHVTPKNEAYAEAMIFAASVSV